jgi:hypothetical protein
MDQLRREYIRDLYLDLTAIGEETSKRVGSLRAASEKRNLASWILPSFFALIGLPLVIVGLSLSTSHSGWGAALIVGGFFFLLTAMNVLAKSKAALAVENEATQKTAIMPAERTILIVFLGNYLINNIVGALVALMPSSNSTSVVTPEYVVFILLAALAVAGLTWWNMKIFPQRSLKSGAIFGVIGFLVVMAMAFISGVTGLMLQTGSLSSVANILPNFGPFLISWSTLVLLAYWVIPAALVGWWLGHSTTGARSV